MACWWMLTVLALVQGVEVADRVSRRFRSGRGNHRSTGAPGRRSTMRSWDAVTRPRTRDEVDTDTGDEADTGDESDDRP